MKRISCVAALVWSLVVTPSIAADVTTDALAAPLKALRRVDSPLLQDSAGIVVQATVGGSQAEAAGLQAGDLLIRYADRPIRSTLAFVNQVGKTSPTDSIHLVFLRQSEPRTLQVRGGRLGVQLFDGSDKFPYHTAKTKLRLSHDGMTVDLHAHGRFHLSAPDAGTTPQRLAAPLTDTAAFSITDWNNLPVPKFNGKSLGMAPDESARALAIAPDASRFVLGTDNALRLFDRRGKALWQTPALAPAWAVNISGDGRYVVAAFVDGSLRWYGASDGRERLAVLILTTQENWLAWTPEGYYVTPNPAEPRLAQEIYPALAPAARQIKQAGGALNPAFHRADLVMASVRGEDVARLAMTASAPADRQTTLHLSLVTNQNLPAPGEVAAPRPMAGNSGNFFSPYTRSGAVAAWVMPAPAAPVAAGSGSEIAGSVGGYVGKEVGNKLLNFVPFGLGGALGSQVGDSMARDATSSPVGQPAAVPLELVKAQSDVSFNTIEELAAYLYSRHASRADYGAVLERTFVVYPDLRRLYAHGIYRADLVATRSTSLATAAGGSGTSARDRLLQLQQLKTDGLITEAEYQARRSKILEGL